MRRFRRNNDRWRLEVGEDLKGLERELWIINGDTEEREDAQMKYGRLKGDSERHISLIVGFANWGKTKWDG